MPAQALREEGSGTRVLPFVFPRPTWGIRPSGGRIGGGGVNEQEERRVGVGWAVPAFDRPASHMASESLVSGRMSFINLSNTYRFSTCLVCREYIQKARTPTETTGTFLGITLITLRH